jgi:small multidrug resistance pump
MTLSTQGGVMWFWLAGAIVAEVTATVSLRYSEGFSRPLPSLVVVAGYAIAFVALSQALERGMPLGVAYGVWAALGVTLVALIGATFLGEPLTWVQVVGIALVVGAELEREHAAATPALIERVDPNWAMETTRSAAARASADSPGPS